MDSVGELNGDELELGKAMLRGRGLLTSTGDAGALAVVAFKEQTSNQNMISGLVPKQHGPSQPMANQSQQTSL